MCSFGDFIKSLEREGDTSRWSSGSEKFSVLLKRLKDSWMDTLPMSTLGEEQRQNEYLADVAQENADTQKRIVELLDPNAQATRERRSATQVSNHERLFHSVIS